MNIYHVHDFKEDEYSWNEAVKIAEGCNKNCTYCVIPSVRGRCLPRGGIQLLAIGIFVGARIL